MDQLKDRTRLKPTPEELAAAVAALLPVMCLNPPRYDAAEPISKTASRQAGAVLDATEALIRARIRAEIAAELRTEFGVTSRAADYLARTSDATAGQPRTERPDRTSSGVDKRHCPHCG